jgi:hypothetical protein
MREKKSRPCGHDTRLRGREKKNLFLIFYFFASVRTGMAFAWTGEMTPLIGH